MKQLQQLQDALVSLRLSEVSKELPAILAKAEKEEVSYLSFLQTLVFLTSLNFRKLTVLPVQN